MLASLAETVEKTGWQVHVWVGMSNHSHLLVATPEANLVKGMAWFQTTGTTRFHARNDLRGSGARFSVLGSRFSVPGSDHRRLTTDD